LAAAILSSNWAAVLVMATAAVIFASSSCFSRAVFSSSRHSGQRRMHSALAEASTCSTAARGRSLCVLTRRHDLGQPAELLNQPVVLSLAVVVSLRGHHLLSGLVGQLGRGQPEAAGEGPRGAHQEDGNAGEPPAPLPVAKAPGREQWHEGFDDIASGTDAAIKPPVKVRAAPFPAEAPGENVEPMMKARTAVPQSNRMEFPRCPWEDQLTARTRLRGHELCIEPWRQPFPDTNSPADRRTRAAATGPKSKAGRWRPLGQLAVPQCSPREPPKSASQKAVRVKAGAILPHRSG